MRVIDNLRAAFACAPGTCGSSVGARSRLRRAVLVVVAGIAAALSIGGARGVFAEDRPQMGPGETSLLAPDLLRMDSTPRAPRLSGTVVTPGTRFLPTPDPRPKRRRTQNHGHSTTRLERRARLRAARHKRWLASDAARSERRRSRAAFRSLTPSESLRVADREFPEVTRIPAWEPPKLRDDEHVAGYLGQTAMRIEREIDQPRRPVVVKLNEQREAPAEEALVDSSEPLVASNGPTRESRPVDLKLVRRDGGFRAENPAQVVTLPADNGGAAQISGTGIAVGLPHNGSRRDAVQNREKLVYGNAMVDTDLFLEAVPRGFALRAILRSPASPEQFALPHTLPDGARIRVDEAGQALIERDGKPLVEITAPIAVDAQNSPVPTRFTARNDTLTIEVDHRSRDVAYPIAVDPEWGTILDNSARHHVWQRAGSWDEQNPNTPGGQYYSLPRETNQLSITGKTAGPADNQWAGWYYPAPGWGQGYVFRTEYPGVRHRSSNTKLEVGQINPANWAWQSAGGAFWSYEIGGTPIPQYSWLWLNFQGPFVNDVAGQVSMAGGYGGYVDVCTAPGCGWSAAPGTAAGFRLYANSGGGHVTSVDGQPAGPMARVARGDVYVTDNNLPVVQGVYGYPGPNYWLSPGTYSGTVQAVDSGLGIRRVTAEAAPSWASVWSWQRAYESSCWGVLENECTYGADFASSLRFATNPDGTLGPHASGIWKLRFKVEDAVGHETTWERNMPIDGVGPEVSFSGPLAARENRIVAERTALNLSVQDGNNAAGDQYAQSGVGDFKVIVQKDLGGGARQTLSTPVNQTSANDGVQAANVKTLDMDPQQAGDQPLIIDPNDYTPGTKLVIRVEADDKRGNTSAKELAFEIGAGQLTSVIEGQRTARYVALQAQGQRPGHSSSTAVRFFYRRPKGSQPEPWTEIPVQSLRKLTAPNTPLANWDSVKLSEAGKRTPKFAWDLTADAMNNFNEGGIEVVALFSGPEGGYSDDVRVEYDQSGLGSPDGQAQVGPGSVDLVSGNLSMTTTDVSVDAFADDLTVSRTYNSRVWLRPGQQPSVFGREWTSPLPVSGEVPDFIKLSYEPMTSSNVENEDGEMESIVEPGYAVLRGSSGAEVAFDEYEDDSGNFWPQDGAENFKLKREGTSAAPTRFVLDDFDSNQEYVYISSADPKVYELKSITDLSDGNVKSTYSWTLIGSTYRLKRMVTPPPKGMTGCAPTSESGGDPARGCRWLDFTYGQTPNTPEFDRLTGVSFGGWSPTEGKVTKPMAAYRYEASSDGGRLIRAINLKAKLATDYVYWSAAEVADPQVAGAHVDLLKSITPNVPVDSNGNTVAGETGDRPWVIRYGRQLIDRGNGRVDSVTRNVPVDTAVDASGNKDATTKMRWFLPAVGGQYDLKTNQLAQQDLPVEGTGVVPPGAASYELDKATISYFNPAGRVVNTAAPGGRISLTEYDARGNVLRTLSPKNRARALAAGTDTQQQDKALRLSGLKRWCVTGPGSRLDAEWGPEHQVKLPAPYGMKYARAEKRYTYDTGYNSGACPETAGVAPATNKEVYSLVTEVRAAARVTEGIAKGGTEEIAGNGEPGRWQLPPVTQPGAPAESDTQRTTTAYDSKWHTPTSTTVDAGGLALTSTTVYDTETGQVIEQRMPRSDTKASASTRLTTYYGAVASASVPSQCVKQEWAGLPCEVQSGAAPTENGAAAGDRLPINRMEYDVFGRPTKTTQWVEPNDTFGAPTRVSTTEYAEDGQVTKSTVSTPSIPGDTDVPDINKDYDLKRRLYKTRDGSKEIVRGFDAIGRMTSYTDASGAVTATTFDLQGRPLKATQTLPGGITKTSSSSYDSVNGDLTSLTDTDLGTVNGTYDAADGQLLEQNFVGANVKLTMAYNEAGEPVTRTYTKTTGCSGLACQWHTSTAAYSMYGKQVQLTAQTGSQPEATQKLAYDNAGRLKQAEDTTDRKCRQYGYTGSDGASGNRTSLTVRPLTTTDDVCDTSAAGQTVDYKYDTADRLLRTVRNGSATPAYTYDRLGRTTQVPGADAGGDDLKVKYYENDLVQEMEQGASGSTAMKTTITLDPALRPLTRTTTVPAATTTTYYGDDGDEPLATKTGSSLSREVEGLDGDLAATRTDSATTSLQISNLHGDVVSEAPVTATTLSSVWGTDEFGVPRQTSSGGGTPGTITRVGTTSAVRSTAATTLDIAKPTGVTTGDLLLAGLSVNSAATVTPPSGWVAVPGGEVTTNSTSATKFKLFYKYATASEGTAYTFTMSGSDKYVGGITAFRNTASSNPVNAVSTATGTGTTITAPSVTPTTNNAAIGLLFGSTTGDSNGGNAWSVASPLTLDWATATGASAANRNGGMASQVLTGGGNTPTGTFTIANLTGNTASVPNAAITAALTPAGVAGPTYQALPRYAYVGAKQRSTTLPTGVIEMGARVYVPQIGRFLQTDPVYGGSANAYDYANQDPVNALDLDGLNPYLWNYNKTVEFFNDKGVLVGKVQIALSIRLDGRQVYVSQTVRPLMGRVKIGGVGATCREEHIIDNNCGSWPKQRSFYLRDDSSYHIDFNHIASVDGGKAVFGYHKQSKSFNCKKGRRGGRACRF